MCEFILCMCWKSNAYADYEVNKNAGFFFFYIKSVLSACFILQDAGFKRN